jgi:hypothetical protein
MRNLLLVESSDLRQSNQYILVRVVPSCFRFAKMCLHQVSLLSKCSPRYFFFSWELLIVYMDQGAFFSSCGECDVDGLDSISFYSPFFKSVLDCS